MLLHYILSTKQKQGTLPKNGAAVKSIVSTSLANKIAASFGVEMFETLTGFKFIGEKIQQFQDTGSHSSASRKATASCPARSCATRTA